MDREYVLVDGRVILPVRGTPIEDKLVASGVPGGNLVMFSEIPPEASDFEELRDKARAPTEAEIALVRRHDEIRARELSALRF